MEKSPAIKASQDKVQLHGGKLFKCSERVFHKWTQSRTLWWQCSAPRSRLLCSSDRGPSSPSINYDSMLTRHCLNSDQITTGKAKWRNFVDTHTASLPPPRLPRLLAEMDSSWFTDGERKTLQLHSPHLYRSTARASAVTATNRPLRCY